MSFLDALFKPKPFPPQSGVEVNKLLEELIKIGVKEDYLSERPGMGYNGQCRHIRTRQIGQKLHDIGGLELMQWSFGKVRKKAGKMLASHLEYAWSDIGDWQA